MASTLSKIWLTIFGQKTQNFVYFLSYDFVQIQIRATLANADAGSLKPLHTLFDTYMDIMLAIIELNRVVRNVQNFELIDKKPSFFNRF